MSDPLERCDAPHVGPRLLAKFDEAVAPLEVIASGLREVADSLPHVGRRKVEAFAGHVREFADGLTAYVASLRAMAADEQERTAAATAVASLEGAGRGK